MKLKPDLSNEWDDEYLREHGIDPQKVREQLERWRESAAKYNPRFPGQVYFVSTADRRAVKIGWTSYRDIRPRMRALQSGNHTRLHLEATVEGEKALEGELHARFAEFQLPGRREWFHLSSDIRRYMDTLPGRRLTAGARMVRARA